MNNLDHITSLKQLVQVAVDDMKAVKANPDYVFDVNQWHEPQSDGKCVVCVAGSIIANTLTADITKYLNPSNFDSGISIKLGLLNRLRVKLTSPANKSLADLGWPPLTDGQERYVIDNHDELEIGDQKAWEGFLDVL